jgi:hypothetical protein
MREKKGEVMSTKNSGTIDETETNAGTPATSTHVDGAGAMIAELHAMQERTPMFSFPTERNSTQKLSTAASVPRAALDKVVAMVETEPSLSASQIGPDELRDLVAFASAYGPVPDEMEATAYGLRHTVTAALNKAGSVALIVYEVAKRQSRRPESAHLRPHVADLKRLLGVRFGKKSKRAQTAEEVVVDSLDQTEKDEE